MAEDYKDLPRAEAMALAEEWAQKGAEVYFKFTCEHCGERCALADANLLHARGECYKCGHETVLDKVGFALMFVREVQEVPK